MTSCLDNNLFFNGIFSVFTSREFPVANIGIADKLVFASGQEAGFWLSRFLFSFNQIRPLLLNKIMMSVTGPLTVRIVIRNLFPAGPDLKMESGLPPKLRHPHPCPWVKRFAGRMTRYSHLSQKPICFGATDDRGLTILEVLVALVLIGILSAVIWSKPPTDATLAARVEAIKAHIRYAQVRSMNTERRWGIQSDGTGYWLFADGDPSGTRSTLPGETQEVVSLASHGISITPFLLTFDAWGRPCSDKDAQNQITTALVLNVTAPGQAPQQIKVTPDTGFIP